MKQSKLLIFLILLVVVAFVVKGFVLKGMKEEYCLDQVLDRHGIEKPMEGEKWEDFTSCYDSFNLGDYLSLF